MPYSLKPEIQASLAKIDFIKRYKALSEKFSDRENTFENYENEKVIAVFESLGYKARFMKRKLFIVGEVKNKNIYTFRFNISLKHGLVEFIWSARHNGAIRAGDPWAMFVAILSNDTEKYFVHASTVTMNSKKS